MSKVQELETIVARLQGQEAGAQQQAVPVTAPVTAVVTATAEGVPARAPTGGDASKVGSNRSWIQFSDDGSGR